MKQQGSLWIAWVLANSLGFALGDYMGSLVGGYGFVALPSNESMIGSVMISGFAAMMQWLVLRHRTALRAVWWTIASAVAGGGGYVLSVGAYFAMRGSFEVRLAVGGAVGGASLGLIQWLFLRRESTRAALWVPANALGYGTAIPIFFSVWSLWRLWRLGETLGYAGMGVVIATITGLALALILPPKPRPRSAN